VAGARALGLDKGLHSGAGLRIVGAVNQRLQLRHESAVPGFKGRFHGLLALVQFGGDRRLLPCVVQFDPLLAQRLGGFV